MTNNTTNTVGITQRLDRIERQNRRLKLGIFAIVLGFGAYFLIVGRQPTSQTVTARKFLLVDHNGKTRASLAMNGFGQPEFRLLDTSGKVQAIVILNVATMRQL